MDRITLFALFTVGSSHTHSLTVLRSFFSQLANFRPRSSSMTIHRRVGIRSSDRSTWSTDFVITPGHTSTPVSHLVMSRLRTRSLRLSPSCDRPSWPKHCRHRRRRIGRLGKCQRPPDPRRKLYSSSRRKNLPICNLHKETRVRPTCNRDRDGFKHSLDNYRRFRGLFSAHNTRHYVTCPSIGKGLKLFSGCARYRVLFSYWFQYSRCYVEIAFIKRQIYLFNHDLHYQCQTAASTSRQGFLRVQIYNFIRWIKTQISILLPSLLYFEHFPYLMTSKKVIKMVIWGKHLPGLVCFIHEMVNLFWEPKRDRDFG